MSVNSSILKFRFSQSGPLGDFLIELSLAPFSFDPFDPGFEPVELLGRFSPDVLPLSVSDKNLSFSISFGETEAASFSCVTSIYNGLEGDEATQASIESTELMMF